MSLSRPKLTAFGCSTHNTEHDFHFGLGEGGRNRWRCSYCPAVDVWRDGWAYWGPLECRTCGWAVIVKVCCPACQGAMATEFGWMPPARKRAAEVRSETQDTKGTQK